MLDRAILVTDLREFSEGSSPNAVPVSHVGDGGSSFKTIAPFITGVWKSYPRQFKYLFITPLLVYILMPIKKNYGDRALTSI